MIINDVGYIWCPDGNLPVDLFTKMKNSRVLVIQTFICNFKSLGELSFYVFGSKTITS